MPPRPSRRTNWNGPTAVPGISTPLASSVSSPADSAISSRHAGQSPAAVALGDRFARQVGQTGLMAGGSASELEPNLSDDAPPNEVSKDVLLNRVIQQIGAADRDGHRFVARMHAEPAVDDDVTDRPTLIVGENVLPVSAAHIARCHTAGIAVVDRSHARVEAVGGRHVQLGCSEASRLRLSLP